MSPFIASWGIIGSGWIASMFVKDLAIPHDEFTDVLHSITAVGSRSKSKAQTFIDENCPKGGVAQQKGLVHGVPQAYGSYDEVYNHKDVNIIYIATLHPTHYRDAKAALEAGKHCLVEKPATLNAAEWKALAKLAKEKNLFLMEGMWTRFQPIISRLQKVLFEDKAIGDIKGVNATFAMCHDTTPDEHRLLAPSAAGGALLDLGAYSFLPTLLALYHNPGNQMSKPEKINGTILRGRTGVDISSTITMTFPKLGAIGTGTANFAFHSPRDERCVISGTKGEVVIHDGLSRITKFTVKTIANDNPLPFIATKWDDDVTIEEPLVGFGLIYEANAVARSIRDNELENSTMPHSETTLVMEILDLVRKQNDYELPDGLEQLK